MTDSVLVATTLLLSSLLLLELVLERNGDALVQWLLFVVLTLPVAALRNALTSGGRTGFLSVAAGFFTLLILISWGKPSRLLPDEILSAPDEAEQELRQQVRSRARAIAIPLVLAVLVGGSVYVWNTA